MSHDVMDRIVYYDEIKDVQVRLGINIFRDVEYIYLRKFYRDFEGEWKPSNEGITMPLGLSNSKELFAGLLEILSLAESREMIVEYFEDLLKDRYV